MQKFKKLVYVLIVLTLILIAFTLKHIDKDLEEKVKNEQHQLSAVSEEFLVFVTKKSTNQLVDK